MTKNKMLQFKSMVINKPPNFFKSLMKAIFINTQNKTNNSDNTLNQIIAPARTPEILRHIGNSYQQLQKSLDLKLGFSNNSDYYFSLANISATYFIELFLNESTKSQINILIIGPADTRFGEKLLETLNDRIKITQLLPFKDAQINEKLKINFIYGNVEYLFTLCQSDMFDIIICAHTFKNFVDPVGTLLQTYQALAKGGIMLIDDFHLNGIHNQLPNLFETLNSNGYAIVADYIFAIQNRELVIDGIRSIFLKKTLPQLVIPGISYNGFKQDSATSLSDILLYCIVPPYQSFKKHVSVLTEEFFILLNELIPSITEDEITKSLFNTNILNNPLSKPGQNDYASTLQESLNYLLSSKNISLNEHPEQVKKLNELINFMGKWIDGLHNINGFYSQLRERLGISLNY